MAEKKKPARKCIGCSEMSEKKTLIRVVRSKEGEISLDLSGKKSGRGAYICNDIECLQKAIKKKALERSLKCKVSDEVYNILRVEIEEFNE